MSDVLRQIEALRSYVEFFWRWWSAELFGLLPKGLARRIVPTRTKSRIRLSDLREKQEAGHDDAPKEGGSETLLVLPSASVLNKPIELPLMSASAAARVLDLDIERQVPLPRDQIYYDFKKVSQDPALRRMRLELRVARKTEIDEAIGSLQAAGWQVRGLEYDRGDRLEKLAFRGAPLDKRRLTLRDRINVALCALIGFLLVANLWASHAARVSQLDAIRAEIEEVRGVALEARALRTQIRNLNAQSAVLLEEKRGQTLVDTLVAVAGALPGETWLSGIRIQEEEVVLSGFKDEGASLIEAFEKHETFTDVRWNGTVRKQPGTEFDRFELALKRRTGL